MDQGTCHIWSIIILHLNEWSSGNSLRLHCDPNRLIITLFGLLISLSYRVTQSDTPRQTYYSDKNMKIELYT